MTAARRRRRSLRSRWKKAAVMMTAVVQGEAGRRMGASMITRQEAAETRVRKMYFLINLASTNYLRENIVRS